MNPPRTVTGYAPPVAPPQDPHRSLVLEAGPQQPDFAPTDYTVTVNPHKTDADGRWAMHLPFHYTPDPRLAPLPVPHALGVTHELLLGVLIDRLAAFQSGKFACAENAAALAYLRLALSALHARSADRAGRGVGPTEK